MPASSSRARSVTLSAPRDIVEPTDRPYLRLQFSMCVCGVVSGCSWHPPFQEYNSLLNRLSRKAPGRTRTPNGTAQIWREAPAAAQALARSARPNLALAGAKRINNYANIEVLWSLIPKNFLSARFARGVCVDLCMFFRPA